MPAKDPAIIFYTSDFYMGTRNWDNEQVGKYIRLLCIQHLNDGVEEDDLDTYQARDDEKIMSKFKKCDDGMYRNKRLQEEIDKRRAFSESRRKNRSKKNDIDNQLVIAPKKDM